MTRRTSLPARRPVASRLVAAALAACVAAAAGVAAGVAAAAPASAPATGPDRSQIDVREVVLDNGMTVLLYRRPGDPNVAAGWIAKVGSVNERPGITGLAHLFEHMMFKGTHVVGTRDIDKDLELNRLQDEVRGKLRVEQEALDARVRAGLLTPEQAALPESRSQLHQELLTQFDELLKQQKELINDNEFDKIYSQEGATGMNAGTTHDFTVYFINLPANKLELWFWMESDRLANPVFRQFYSERDVVWEERRMRVDSTPTGKLDEQFDALFWRASPYSWPVIGWPSDLNGITREEADAFFDANYSPSNLTAAIVGDFDVDEAERLARLYFSRLKRSERPPTPVRTFEPPQEGILRYEAEAETRPTVKLRWHSVPYGHRDEPAMNVLADLLNGETGRLEKTLVKETKVASTASAGQDSRRYGGYFQITGIAAADRDVAELEDALLEEVRKLSEQPVSARELEKVKNAALATKYRRLDGNFTIMIQLLIYDVFGDWRDMQTEADKYLAVTAEDVQRVAAKYLAPATRNVAVYRTKQAAPGAADDPIAALAPELQPRARAMKAQFDQATDVAQLEQAQAEMSGMQAQVPPPMQPLMAWALEYLTTRIAALKGGAQ